MFSFPTTLKKMDFESVKSGLFGFRVMATNHMWFESKLQFIGTFKPISSFHLDKEIFVRISTAAEF